jgi:hypothetical protein
VTAYLEANPVAFAQDKILFEYGVVIVELTMPANVSFVLTSSGFSVPDVSRPLQHISQK